MRIAKLILHHNRDDLTASVLRVFSDAIVIDNGSDRPFPGAHMRFENNLGFTRGFNTAIRRLLDDYDAFMLLNNDIETELVMAEKIQYVLRKRPRLGIVSPHCNGPHPLMWKKTDGAVRHVPYVEFVAATIRREVFQEVGLLDERFSLGWGVDFDFCWRARRAGFSVGVYDLVGVHHKEHATIDSTVGRTTYFTEAGEQMQRGLEEKYGSDWYRLLTTMVGALVIASECQQAHGHLSSLRGVVDEVTVGIPTSEPTDVYYHPSENSGRLFEFADSVVAIPDDGWTTIRALSAATSSDWQLLLWAGDRLTDRFAGELRGLLHDDQVRYLLTKHHAPAAFHSCRLFHRHAIDAIDGANWDGCASIPYPAVVRDDA